MDKLIPGLNGLRLNNIYCIGRNYARHAAEMNSKVPEEPIVFLRPNGSILFNGGDVLIPRQSSDVHHEVEAVVAIGKKGRDLTPDRSAEHIAGIAVGIDFTARDLQNKAKREGLPWSVAKGFDTFAPVSRFREAGGMDLNDLDIRLSLNGYVVQKGDTKQMIFSVHQLISYLSTLFTLYPGDLLFTGTPAGVGPVKKGDLLVASLNTDLLTLSVNVR